MAVSNKAIQIRREIQERIAQLIFNETLLDEIDKIPMKMRPRGSESFRCCIYRDRALIKYKIMAMLGFECTSEADELSPLSDFVLQSFVKAASDREIMRVVEEVCHGCQQNNYVVTNMCRGCLGRPCEVNCPKEAINFVGARAMIDHQKCVSCGICEGVCPYHAIIYAPVPCEESCPVGAITKSETGKEIIDFDKCTYCGKCVIACPFGAIVEESHLFDLIFSIKRKKKVVALLAPSVAAQFKCSLPQMKKALLQIGFHEVIYVAEGADLTAQQEAQEFVEKGGNLLTTSCCPSFVNMIEKHVPTLKGHVSHTPSPMVFAARLSKQRYPNARTVFVGPCIAKKAESFSVSEIDMVINFEELDAMLLACKIDPGVLEVEAAKIEASAEAWGFAQTGGVLEAVKKQIGEGIELKPLVINGIDKKSIKLLGTLSKGNQYNFVEGMSCEGGCVGGCYMNIKPQVAQTRINKVKEQINTEKEL
ncbi:MAG TPA: monomeric [FeFe] hydrogenase [Prolixibacteraceae bacterium]|nr:monomeric [FeFe] hydrogenase [Prolixibacteraceae bacterium]HPS12873.1 monomeric [FeFe] hydrogenase [Prolixibacteraceae bacterium]